MTNFIIYIYYSYFHSKIVILLPRRVNNHQTLENNKRQKGF